MTGPRRFAAGQSEAGEASEATACAPGKTPARALLSSENRDGGEVVVDLAHDSDGLTVGSTACAEA